MCEASTSGGSNVSVSRIAFPKLTKMTAAFRVFLTLNQHRAVMETVDLGQGRTEISLAELTYMPAQLDRLHADVVRLARTVLSRARA